MDKYVSNALGKGLAAFMAGVRKDLGLTQAELAARLGRPQPLISHIERGERRVDILEFCEIARAMDLDPEELFGRFMQQVWQKKERDSGSSPERAKKRSGR